MLVRGFAPFALTVKPALLSSGLVVSALESTSHSEGKEQNEIIFIVLNTSGIYGYNCSDFTFEGFIEK